MDIPGSQAIGIVDQCPDEGPAVELGVPGLPGVPDETNILVVRVRLFLVRPMRRSNCNLFGGCEFRGICDKDPSSRERFLKAGFVKEAK